MSKIQIRRGTAAQWTTANPVLASGEIGFETDTNKFKIGDGTTAWTNLDYLTNKRITQTVAGTTRTLTKDDNNKHIVFTSNSDVLVAVAAQASSAFFDNTEIRIEQNGTGKLTITGIGDLVFRSPLGSPVETTTRYQVLTLRRTGVNQWVIY